jgi:hypothetical protein
LQEAADLIEQVSDMRRDAGDAFLADRLDQLAARVAWLRNELDKEAART